MDYTKTSEQLLVDLIDEANSTSFSFDYDEFFKSVFLSDPVDNSDPNYDTKITLKAVSTDPGYKGSIDFYYNRVLLTSLVSNHGDNIHLPDDGNIVAQINIKYGTNFYDQDFINIPDITESGTYIFTVRTNHIVFKGSMSLEITLADDDKVSLSDLFGETNLNGFYYP